MLNQFGETQDAGLDALRIAAEAALANGYPVVRGDHNAEDAAQIIHELQVHQVELQMQNEDLQATENELQRSRQRYIDLYEYAPIGYVTIDEAGKVVLANLTSALMLGMPKSDLIGRSFSDYVSPDYQDGYYLQHKTLFERHIPCTYDVKLIRLDQSSFDARIVSSSDYLRQTNFDSHAHLAIIDISRQKVAERQRIEAENANRGKSTFLAVISHELRSPLTSVLGFASTLLDTSVPWKPEEERQFIEIIHVEATKLLELVQRLLEVSRLEAGALPIHLHPHSLHSILEVAMVELSTLTSAHTLLIDIPDNLPAVKADDARIAQVLVNLVNNAARHAPAGSCIHLSAHLVGSFVQIEVSDEGIGIPADKRETMFEMFRQGDSASVQGGAGLGLAICKGLVEAHNGRIWVKAQDAPGATLIFTLPIA